MASVTIPHSEVLDIQSQRAEGGYQLWVARPVAGLRPLPPDPLPVLWVLDGNLFFGTAVESTRLMFQLFQELPPMWVVGVAYDTDQPAVQAELRARDFTPTGDAGFGAMPANLPGASEPTLPPDRRLGRAKQFLDFLTEEAIPMVEERYAVAPGRHVLFGSSLGGLFVLYALLKATSRFQAYLSVSPGLWWDDARLLGALADNPPALTPVQSVFLAAGGLEEHAEIPMLARFKMITNMEAFAEGLRSETPSGVRVDSQVLEGETHTSVVPAGLTRGLRFVFAR
ncbi:MAG: alpha/beta hydrolase [Gemmatimonadetes bacterium]|nr:alpha/beta hydrolase [Gemmatimonadota bacterium]